MSELTREALEALIADDEHGLLVPEVKSEPVTNADILANRFEDINAFIDEYDRKPDPENREDIGEFQLGHRLNAILENPEYRSSLDHLDRHGLFEEIDTATPGSIDELLAGKDPLLDDLLESDSDTSGLFEHTHVPPPSKEAPDKVARGKLCKDFELFEQGFLDCHADLRSGRRQLSTFRNPKYIKKGAFYVQRGMLVYVAEVGELTQKSPGLDGRLRCIFENGTESDLLLQSLARSLYDDGKIVTEPQDVTHENFLTADHMATGYVYVARTHSKDPKLSQFENLHKIGYTTNNAEDRVASVETDPTFLSAPASLAATFKMPAEYAKHMETVLHQFFSAVRLDVWFDGGPTAREWFDVPLTAIEEAVDLIQTSQLHNYHYDPTTRTIKLAT